MHQNYASIWKTSPACRILLAQVTGIVASWYSALPLQVYNWILFSSFVFLFTHSLLPAYKHYRARYLNGMMIFLLLTSTAAINSWQANPLNKPGTITREEEAIAVVIKTEPVEKPKTFKAEGIVSHNGKGRIILYFKKDSLQNIPVTGSMVLFKKPLQEISNKGIPGGFDYKNFCIRKGITHQVFLAGNEFVIADSGYLAWHEKILIRTRNFIISLIQRSIKDEKKAGLAEALLIGYKQDLDHSLVKSYTNTGVVHIIAISGLHIGLIYWLLSILVKPFQKNRKLSWLSSLFIIIFLWGFSLLAGGQPSVLRSALMFSCISIGNSLSRKTPVFNSLAISAILQLAYNPFWLWDVGFQLSYSAVLSIILFMKPIYNLLVFSNRLLDTIWKLNSVTLAAQILTLPICIFYFHQFPNYFLLTNMIAVPLSTIILFSEIFLCMAAVYGPLSIMTGKLISAMIGFMNSYIEKFSSLPYSVSYGLNISFPVVAVVYILIFLTLLPYEKKD